MVDLSASTNGGAVMLERSPEIVAMDYEIVKYSSLSEKVFKRSVRLVLLQEIL